MNILIFAGGAGTRLWPLSRKASPKQFEKFKDDESTLQMAVNRVRDFGLDNVYISTNHAYIGLVREQIPELNQEQILSEPAKRDLAAAVGLALLRLKKQGISGTIALLWADHFMNRPENFLAALKQADALIQEDSNRFIFLGEHPRFANHNLGWINVGEQIQDNVHAFSGWKYRPELLKCQEMFESSNWVWNPGYFVFDIDFVLSLYREFMSDMYVKLEQMVEGDISLDTQYEQLEAISFDEAIIEKVSTDQAVVLKVDLGWSDPGTLYALKEALVTDEEKNLEQGLVMDLESRDSFIFNEEDDKLVATIGLDGMVVVNTTDAILVCKKEDVPRVKELLKKIEEKGLEKYL